MKFQKPKNMVIAMKQDDKKEYLIPRLPIEAVEKLKRGTTIKSKKKYNRKKDKKVEEGKE